MKKIIKELLILKNGQKKKVKNTIEKYKCKWQLALFGDLEYNSFVLEEDMLKEMSEYHSNSDDNNQN